MTNEKSGLIVLTVAYHSQRALTILATQFAKQESKPYKWLVVNNSPKSATPIKLAPEPYITIIDGEEGDGFGRGCNRGLDYLLDMGWDGWVWLLNPDTKFTQPKTLKGLEALLNEIPQKALIGTGVVDSNGVIEPSAGWIDSGLSFRRRTITSMRVEKVDGSPVEVDWVSGCSLLLKPNAHEILPRFEISLPLYYEDIDLCIRMKKLGLPILWLFEIQIFHQKGDGSDVGSTRRLRLSSCSYTRFLQRHRPGWVFFTRTIRLLVKNSVLLCVMPRRSFAVLQGWWDAFCEPLV